MALNWNAVLSNTKNLNDVLAILRKILALMDSKTDSDVIDRALRDIDELKEEVARLSNLVEHCNCSTEPEPGNPGGEDRFIISCMPPEGQQQIILNKVRNTLPFLTFRNITFDIYISGTLAASDVLMLDVDAMDSVGLQVEDLTGNGREISIKNKTDERRAFELSPIEEPNFARDTDIELGHVVVEKYSFHFCLAPVSVEPENPDGGDRFIISCTPPEGQQRIVLNKVRNTLPFLTFSNVVFDIYIDGTPAASGVSLLDATAMDLVGLNVEDLAENGRQVAITSKSGEQKAFELMPAMRSFADDTDIEEGNVVVEKGSFHFCLAAVIAEPELSVTMDFPAYVSAGNIKMSGTVSNPLAEVIVHLAETPSQEMITGELGWDPANRSYDPESAGFISIPVRTEVTLSDGGFIDEPPVYKRYLADVHEDGTWTFDEPAGQILCGHYSAFAMANFKGRGASTGRSGLVSKTNQYYLSPYWLNVGANLLLDKRFGGVDRDFRCIISIGGMTFDSHIEPDPVSPSLNHTPMVMKLFQQLETPTLKVELFDSTWSSYHAVRLRNLSPEPVTVDFSYQFFDRVIEPSPVWVPIAPEDCNAPILFAVITNGMFEVDGVTFDTIPIPGSGGRTHITHMHIAGTPRPE